ncbi:MAG TPA: low specificity L-threonine aldolase [Casimicrobiaceae bacterium]|nr:low specificity L-threonine aldolase [Casimicrobiaceae bacterium]
MSAKGRAEREPASKRESAEGSPVGEPLSPQFGSDNYAGICPEAWRALEAANRGHAPGYGGDDWTRAATQAIQRAFETDCDVYFVFNGTAANALALSAICRNTDAAVCHALAHVNVDECGATEFMSGGARLLPVEAPLAKLTPEAVVAKAVTPHDEHSSRPRAVSLTQATELGTVYTLAEVRALCDLAHARGMRVQMDGARFANAVVTLGASPADASWRAGVDVLCLGGTKNGLPAGEAMLFFDRGLADEFARRRKQAGQLASKMRFLAAPWLGVLESGAWLAHAAHANAMARRLADGLRNVPGSHLIAPVEANGVFVDLPKHAIDALHKKGWRFYVFVGDTGVRLMCAWDTTSDVVDRFLDDLKSVLTATSPRSIK